MVELNRSARGGYLFRQGVPRKSGIFDFRNRFIIPFERESWKPCCDYHHARETGVGPEVSILRELGPALTLTDFDSTTVGVQMICQPENRMPVGRVVASGKVAERKRAVGSLTRSNCCVNPSRWLQVVLGRIDIFGTATALGIWGAVSYLTGGSGLVLWRVSSNFIWPVGLR